MYIIRISVPALALLAATSCLSAAAAKEPAEPRLVFERTCSRCHPSARALERTRGEAQWRKIVRRMRGRAAGSANAFGRGTAETVVAYLAGKAVTASEPAKRSWERLFEEPAAALGIVTAALLLVMIGTGFGRGFIGGRFRRVHAAAAALLAVALACHASLLYAIHGPPDAAWHWAGSTALCMLVVTALGGLLRRRLGSRFLRLHGSGALATLVLAALHRLLTLI
ncbi:MAG: hypothetical protein ABII00_11925 [Elusimicrobiota bacterium]